LSSIPLPAVFAKLAGLQKVLSGRLEDRNARYFDPATVTAYFEQYIRLATQLRDELPALFDDLEIPEVPPSSGTSDYDGRGYIDGFHLDELHRKLSYIFEVRAHSELASPVTSATEFMAFISHGRSAGWHEVQAFVEKDLNIPTIELAQQPNRGRSVLQKLDEEGSSCSYAIIVMTGDDEMADGTARARENVMHEIGFFQGRFGLANVCILHEEGTNIPSNIHGLVYIPFPKGQPSFSFGALMRELRDARRT
jgi:predicted nucleotide-binding protein